MRYFIEVAYDGSAYHGWQMQPNAHSVQAELEEKLSLLLKHRVAVTGSGRTDTGVHCLSQYAHFDTEPLPNLEAFRVKANLFFSRTLAIKSVRQVAPLAHARFDAERRTYLYRISTEKNPLTQGYAWQMFKPLNVEAMNLAAQQLIGEKDFEVFSKTQTDVRHHRCRLERAEWQRVGDELHFTIVANRFLRGMVRLIVGTLVGVGLGNLSAEDFATILEGSMDDRHRILAPAHGLYLAKVEYPDRVFETTDLL